MDLVLKIKEGLKVLHFQPCPGCEGEIARTEKGTHPPGESPTFPEAWAASRAGQRSAPCPSCPTSSMGSSHCYQQVPEAKKCGSRRLKAAFLHLSGHPALPPLGCSLGPTTGLSGVGGQARPGGAAWPSPLAASLMPSVTQQGSQGQGGVTV